MALDLFKTNHVLHLQGNVAHNLMRYTERKSWAGKPTGGGSVRLTSALEPAIPLDLEMPEGGELKDFENTKIIYSAFPNLTPLQARDPRLWVRLTHMECWAYMRKRWDVSCQTGDTAKQTYVLEHYFVRQSQSRMLLRNGIARLWWYGHLTHDPKRADPWELTRVLLSSLDIAKNLLERNMGRAHGVRIGFLDYLRKNETSLGATAEQRRNRIRALARFVNLRGGVTLLDCLTPSDVEAALATEIGAGHTI